MKFEMPVDLLSAKIPDNAFLTEEERSVIKDCLNHLKILAALSEYFDDSDFGDVLDSFYEDIEDIEFFNKNFKIIFENFEQKYREILTFYENEIKPAGIHEFPISSKYSIETWANKWVISMQMLRKLEKWFKIDYKKIEND